MGDLLNRALDSLFLFLYNVKKTCFLDKVGAPFYSTRFRQVLRRSLFRPGIGMTLPLCVAAWIFPISLDRAALFSSMPGKQLPFPA